jgi:hypothetical protein
MKWIQPSRFSAGGGSGAWLTGSPTGSTRSDFTGNLGCQFTVGGSNLSVTHLGRWIVSGNSGDHWVKVSTTAGTLLATITFNATGKPAGDYYWEAITPITLNASSSYFIYASELNGGDAWYDQQVISSTAVASIDNAAYDSDLDDLLSNSGDAGKVFVPVNFKYAL